MKDTVRPKARCRECYYLNWNYLTLDYEVGDWFCGLHGMAAVDPDGDQPDLNHHGGCGFHKADEPRQYQLFG